MFFSFGLLIVPFTSSLRSSLGKTMMKWCCEAGNEFEYKSGSFFGGWKKAEAIGVENGNCKMSTGRYETKYKSLDTEIRFCKHLCDIIRKPLQGPPQIATRADNNGCSFIINGLSFTAYPKFNSNLGSPFLVANDYFFQEARQNALCSTTTPLIFEQALPDNDPEKVLIRNLDTSDSRCTFTLYKKAANGQFESLTVSYQLLSFDKFGISFDKT